MSEETVLEAQALKPHDEQQPPVAPVQFSYTETDPGENNPYPMTTNNLAPALVAWLIVTTNPEWIGLVATGHRLTWLDPDGNAQFLSIEQIAASVGLTAGCLQFILDLATDESEVDNVNTYRAAFMTVCNRFQQIALPSANWRPPICPPTLQHILKLAQSAWVANPAE